MVPAALGWLRTGGRVLSLVKPHYELDERDKARLMRDGVLPAADAERVLAEVLDAMPALGASVSDVTRSPMTGGKSSRKQAPGGGNIEFLVLLERGAAPPRE